MAMAKRLRLIPQHEWEEFMQCKRERKNTEPETDDLKLLKDKRIPADIKLSLYGQNNKRKIVRVKPTKDVSLIQEEPQAKIMKHQLVAQATKQFQTELEKPPRQEDVPEDELSLFMEQANIIRNTRAWQHSVLLLTIFKNNPKIIKWNSKGELSFGSGPFIPGTNIAEVLAALFRSIHIKNEPKAFHRVLFVMKYFKIPPYLIINSYTKGLYNMVYMDQGFNPTPSTLNTTVAANVSSSSTSTDNVLAGINTSPNKFEALNVDDEID